MEKLEKIDTVTDFRLWWKRISSQKNNGVPIRQSFFCDCGYHAPSHQLLFVHTSNCSRPAMIAQWGASLVVMPKRELAALYSEWKALLSDETLAQQIWAIAYSLVRMPVCPLEILLPKFCEVAAWYGLCRAQAMRLWETTRAFKH